MPVKTIGTGGDYTTIAAWLASIPANITGLGDYEGQLLNQSFNVGSGVSFTGITTTTGDRVILSCAPGASFRDNPANPLRLSSSFGALITSSTTYTTLLSISINNFILRGVQVDNSVGSSIAVRFNVAGTVEGCLLANQDFAPLYATFPSGGMTIRNTILVQKHTAAYGLRLGTAGTGTSTITNCLIVRPSSVTKTGDTTSNIGINVDTSPTNTVIKNTAIFNFLLAWNWFGQAGTGNNATDLASMGSQSGYGSGNLTSQVYNNQFVSNGATPDWKLASGSNLINAGVTDSTNAPADIYGVTRPQGSAYDIGPVELAVANSPPATPTISSGSVGPTSATLTSSAFSDPDVGDTHAASQWQLTAAADTGYASALLDTGDDATHKTSLSVTGLTASTAYIARVRYKDSAGNYSSYSTSTPFSTTTVPLASGTASFASSGPTAIAVTATAASGGTPSYTYIWQRSTTSGSGFSDLTNGGGVAGASSLAGLSDGSATAGTLYYYRLKAVDSAPATVFSNEVAAQVYPGGSLTGGGLISGGSTNGGFQ